MKLPLRTFAFGLIGLVLLTAIGAVVALALAFQPAPAVEPTSTVDNLLGQLRRLPERLRQHDPRRAVEGRPRSAVLSQGEAEWLLAQAARRGRHGLTVHAVRLGLSPGVAVVRGSVEGPATPFGRWLNVEAVWREAAAGPPVLDRLTVGRLPVPAAVGEALVRRAAVPWAERAEVRLALDAVQAVHFGAGSVEFVYAWPADAAGRLTDALLPPAEQARLHAYHERLAALAAGARGQASLASVLPPMFALARERTAAGGAAVGENRAALFTLALHVTGRSWRGLVPQAAGWPAVAPLRLTLAGRDDFAQHWLMSAALAIEGGGALADAVGLSKELQDARSGSGFSFNDLAADRAGTRIGQLARREPGHLQARLADGVREADVMPDVADLPEFLREGDFLARYGGVGTPAYERMRADIEARVEALPVLR